MIQPGIIPIKEERAEADGLRYYDIMTVEGYWEASASYLVLNQQVCTYCIITAYETAWGIVKT